MAALDLLKADYTFDQIVSQLATYELKFEKQHLDQERLDALKSPKSKSLALKSKIRDESSSSDDDKSDEEMEIFTRRFTRYLSSDNKGSRKFKETFQNPSDYSKGQKEVYKGKSKIICFNCDKAGHIQPDCPEIKNRKNTKFEKKRYKERKAMIAQFGESDSDESSSSEEEEEVAHFCLMAKEIENDEVTSYSNDNLLDEYNELQDAFDELFNEHKQLLLKHEALKVNCRNHVDKTDVEKLKSEKEALINDKIVLESKVEDLTCSLDKFT